MASSGTRSQYGARAMLTAVVSYDASGVLGLSGSPDGAGDEPVQPASEQRQRDGDGREACGGAAPGLGHGPQHTTWSPGVNAGRFGARLPSIQ